MLAVGEFSFRPDITLMFAFGEFAFGVFGPDIIIKADLSSLWSGAEYSDELCRPFMSYDEYAGRAQGEGS